MKSFVETVKSNSTHKISCWDIFAKNLCEVFAVQKHLTFFLIKNNRVFTYNIYKN